MLVVDFLRHAHIDEHGELSSDGMEQVKWLREKFLGQREAAKKKPTQEENQIDERYNLVFASPLPRAFKTAELLQGELMQPIGHAFLRPPEVDEIPFREEALEIGGGNLVRGLFALAPDNHMAKRLLLQAAENLLDFVKEIDGFWLQQHIRAKHFKVLAVTHDFLIYAGGMYVRGMEFNIENLEKFGSINFLEGIRLISGWYLPYFEEFLRY